ncbi:MAG: hypothetical protein ABJE95_24830 [Byssovorax sp.]
MRTPFFFLTIAALTVGCGPGPDPALGDCATRKAGSVIIGTGEDDFTPMPSAGVPINYGSQGGQHIWLGLSCQNLGPKVTVHLKITDVETGLELSQHGLAVAVDLEYDGKGSDLAHGIYGYLGGGGDPTAPDTSGSGGASTSGSSGSTGGAAPMITGGLAGRKIKVEADVADLCNKPAIHAEVVTKISSS